MQTAASWSTGGWAAFALVIASMFYAAPAQAQEQAQEQQEQWNVEGTVIDSTSSTPLPGVNVVIQGTTIGAATDADGRYSLSVPSPQDTLVFSFVGYATKTVPIQERSEIDVELQPSVITGEELVVLGYTAQEQEEVSGSVSTVSGEDLVRPTTSNPMEMLQGKTSGVFVAQGSGDPGSDPEIRVRGIGSVTAGSGPLYVIDGIISDSYSNVNPNDIASISVLKGPTATSIYGSRASNGVIVITTKQGTAGETRINVNVAGGSATALHGNIEMMDAQQLYDFYQEMGAPLPVEQASMPNTNWRDVMFAPATIQNYQVSASTGTEDTRVFLSGNYFSNEGTLRSTGFDRLGARLNVEHEFSEDLTLGAKAFGQFERHQNDPTGYNAFAAWLALPWDDPYREDGTVRQGIVGRNWLSRDVRNPLYAQLFNWNRSRNNYFTLDGNLTYEFVDWLTFTSNNRTTFYFDRAESYADPRTIYGSNTGGDLYNSSYYSNLITTSNLLQNRHTFGSHNVQGLLGFEFQRFHDQNTNVTGTGIQNFEVLDLAANPYAIGGYKNAYSFISGFTQVRYNYADRYGVTGSVRLDGSSRFGANNRYGTFYALGGSWTLTEEPFFENLGLDFVNVLRLRLGYGTTGNAQIENYAAQSLQNYGLQYNGQAGSYPATLGNPNLTWEKQSNLNLGLDAEVLSGRVSLAVDVYQKESIDLLQGVPLPYETGFSSQLQNVGTVRNRGIEFGLSTFNVQTSSFQWSTNLNLSLNRNTVIDLYEDRDILGFNSVAVGYPINTWYMRDWAGVDPETGDPLWERIVTGPDGQQTVELTSDYNAATLQFLGDAAPDLTGGLTNTFQYRGISLSFLINAVYGNQIYSQILQRARSDGGYPTWNQIALPEGYSRWQEPGDEATEPRPVYGGNNLSYQPSSRFLMDGSFLRLQNVQLSYTIPQSLTQSLQLERAEVYLSADNLWTLTSSDYIGPDPASYLSGQDFLSKYPVSRKFMFGINFAF